MIYYIYMVRFTEIDNKTQKQALNNLGKLLDCNITIDTSNNLSRKFIEGKNIGYYLEIQIDKEYDSKQMDNAMIYANSTLGYDVINSIGLTALNYVDDDELDNRNILVDLVTILE
jgi:hypothetical protein